MNAHLKYYLLLFVFLIHFFSIQAQQEKDTLNIYYRIEKKADKNKFTRFIYESIFQSPDNVEVNGNLISLDKIEENHFKQYKGKIIRQIKITTLDPFGFSVNDTSKKHPSYIQRAGNNYHFTTKHYIIRNLLLFKVNEETDPLLLSESERLLRNSAFINDARIYVKTLNGGNNDSIDVEVVAMDKWSTIISSDLDLNKPNILLIERNIFGIGHRFEENISWSNSDNEITTNGNYSVANIRNTFISSSVFYSAARNNQQYGVSLDRPFYSPLAKWAGGIRLTSNYSYFNYINSESGLTGRAPVHYYNEDYWAAKSFPVTTKKAASIKKRSSSYIVGLRYYHLFYTEHPSYDLDVNMLYNDQTMYLSNFGYTRRKYYHDHYLYRFGANEDIPEGISIETVNGTLKRELSSLWYYSGIKITGGQHISHFGYLSSGISYGTYYDKSFIKKGVVNFDVFYFSDLIKTDGWYFRQFTRYKITHGIDRDVNEKLTINGTQMYDFSSTEVAAKSKMVLNLEFVMYAPYKIIGFKFAPVFMMGFGTVGDNVETLFNSRIYQSFALGLLIRNEYLISNTFELSLGLYPFMPGYEDNTFKTNPIKSYSVRARDFGIAKPDLVPYQ